MRRRSNTPYLILIGTLLLLLSLPKHVTESLRGTVASFFGPVWEAYAQFKLYSEKKLNPDIIVQEELSKSLLENELLKMELSRLNDILKSELNLQSYLKELEAPEELSTKLTQQRRKQLRELLKVEMSALPAKVVYRSPSAWNSTLWINVGTDKGIEKNSPVVVGDAIIGVIDYVGGRQSRVRMITDSALTPAVRIVRGALQQEHISLQLDDLEDYLLRHTELFESGEQKSILIGILQKLQRRLQSASTTLMLAKGEIQGSGAPLWRAGGKLLQGVGFNYDFADEEGGARDLRTGKLENDWTDTPIPLVEPYDLLVTTGMDGVFPPGLKVGTVTKVYPMKEGDIAYQLTARPVAKDLDDLTVVYVIRPVGFTRELSTK
jgi:cell shape-determining protein MreC